MCNYYIGGRGRIDKESSRAQQPDIKYVVMERDKFYFNDSYKYAYFDDISGIVTDEFPDDTIVSTLERAGVKLF